VLAAQDQLAQIRHERVEARLKLASALASLRLAVGAIEVENQSRQAIAAQFYSVPTP